MSALRAAKGIFTASPGRNRHVVDDLGFAPRAVVAWWSRQAGPGVAWGNRGGIGFWTATERVAVAWRSDDGVPEVRARTLAAEAAVLGLGAGHEVAMRADAVSLDPGGFTLEWAIAPAETWTAHFLALGGSAVHDARAGWTDEPQLEADSEPGLLLLVPAAPADGDGVLAIGVSAASARSRAAACFVSESGARPGAVVAAQRPGAFALVPEGDASPRVRRFGYLALGGVRARTGTDTSPVRPGRRRTRVGFRADALLLFTWGLAGSRLPSHIGRLCLGGATAAASGSVGWADRNVEAPETRTLVLSSVDDVLAVVDTRTGGMHARARLVGIDDRGFTLDWPESDGTARQFVHVALAAAEERRAAGPRALVDAVRRRLV